LLCNLLIRVRLPIAGQCRDAGITDDYQEKKKCQQVRDCTMCPYV
jgi:hypothetical protein